MKTKEEVDALFEQVKHLIGSDEPVKHPWEIHPYDFTESERADLLAQFPEHIDDSNAGEFLRRVALVIGTYHRLNESEEPKLSNSEARKKLAALRKSVVDTHDRFAGLPVRLRGEIDLALQHVLQSKKNEQDGAPVSYVRSYMTPYSDSTSKWVTSFITQLNELAIALDLIEEHKQEKRGGNPVDRAMSYLSLHSAKAYRDCFAQEPTPTEGKPFERILANLAEIVGRHDNSTDGNVMHYVRKAVKDLEFVRKRV